jgi:hypothetical protein
LRSVSSVHGLILAVRPEPALLGGYWRDRPATSCSRENLVSEIMMQGGFWRVEDDAASATVVCGFAVVLGFTVVSHSAGSKSLDTPG